MKKILLSILAIALTVGTVSASAYALFSDTVNIAGVTITSGNADLKITDSGSGTDVTNPGFVSMLSTSLSKLYPGKFDYTIMDFENTSASNIDLDLSVRLANVSGNWGELYNNIEMAIADSGNSFSPPTEGWNTLDYWYSADRPFGVELAPGAANKKSYRVFIRVKDAGNEIANKWLNLNLVFTGKQAK